MEVDMKRRILGNWRLSVLIGLVLGSSTFTLLEAADTYPSGLTATTMSAENCRAYATADAGKIVDTSWGIRNGSGGSVWVTCPVTGQQHVTRLDNNDLRYFEVYGWLSNPSTQAITCQVKIESADSSVSFTQTADLQNFNGPPHVSVGQIPASGSWPSIAAAAFYPRTILWCNLPPGAYLYQFTLFEQVM
jgi:hypothetical protein